MNLKTENTVFIFVMTSKNNLEDRFVDDFKNTGLVILKQIGFPESKITIVSDTSKDELQNRHGLSSALSFIDSSQLLTYLETINCDNLIIVSSCHGSYEGFDSKTKIQPFPFVTALKNNPYTKNVLVMFGQCYSGIFNYSALDCNNKTIVYMGASWMNASTSTAINVSINGKLQTWSGNVAVCYFFDWILNRKDIDGDNLMTVMDLYKYVSMMVLFTNDKIEHESYADWLQKRLDLDKKVDETDKTDTTAMKLLQDEINKHDKQYILPRQLPWIHNMDGALTMSVEY